MGFWLRRKALFFLANMMLEIGLLFCVGMVGAAAVSVCAALHRCAPDPNIEAEYNVGRVVHKGDDPSAMALRGTATAAIMSKRVSEIPNFRFG